jgi:hypothetical protein
MKQELLDKNDFEKSQSMLGMTSIYFASFLSKQKNYSHQLPVYPFTFFDYQYNITEPLFDSTKKQFIIQNHDNNNKKNYNYNYNNKEDGIESLLFPPSFSSELNHDQCDDISQELNSINPDTTGLISQLNILFATKQFYSSQPTLLTTNCLPFNSFANIYIINRIEPQVGCYNDPEIKQFNAQQFLLPLFRREPITTLLPFTHCYFIILCRSDPDRAVSSLKYEISSFMDKSNQNVGNRHIIDTFWHFLPIINSDIQVKLPQILQQTIFPSIIAQYLNIVYSSLHVLNAAKSPTD